MITKEELMKLQELHDRAIDAGNDVFAKLVAGNFFKGAAPEWPHIYLDASRRANKDGTPVFTLGYENPDDGTPDYLILRTEWLTGEKPVEEFLEAEKERLWKEHMLHEELVVRPKELKELKRLLEKYGQSLRMEQYTLG